VDLNQDAELLEASTKKNDKYTVRRILDVHYYHFRFKRNSIDFQINNNNNNNAKNENEAKQTSDYFKNNSIDLPSIFFNILHLAIEHNAMDVLRICLKYGLDANKSGTILDTVNSSSSKFENDNKSICNYCSADNKKILKLNNNVTIYNNNPAFLFILSTKQTTLTTNLIEINEPPPQIDDINQQQQQVNYSSYSYLVQYPPLFLSISKCNHAATELLLTYGVCTNIKDNFGNTPLHLAVAKQPPCYECVYLLIKHHAKSLVINNNLQLPSDILNQLSNINSNQASLPVNNNNNNNNNKTNWDYSINTIHLNLIKDIFKTLETLKNNQTNKLIEENENDQQQQQTSSTSNLKPDKQRNFFKKSNTQIHNKRNHNNNTTTTTITANNNNNNTNKMNDLHIRPRKMNSLKGSLKQKRLSLSNPVSIAAEAETIGGGGETSGSGGQHLLLPVVISLDDNDEEEDNDVVFDNSKLLNSNNKRYSSSELISSSTITVTNQSTTNLSKKKQQNKSKKNKQKTTEEAAAAASSLSLDKLNEQNTSTSMINFTGTTPSPIITPLNKQKKMLNSLNYVTNNLKNNNKSNNLINDERLMIQKNARYSKPVTAKSAVVVRMATLTQFSKKFTKQNSISAINTAINNNNYLTNNKKLNDSSILNDSFPQSSIEDDYSRSNIIPKINDNVSLVSSKITLFKKSVS
jgi:hypothetical protein